MRDRLWHEPPLQRVQPPLEFGQYFAQLGKATYPSTVGLPEASRLARRERDASLAAIARLGQRAEPLRAIAAMVVGRVGV